MAVLDHRKTGADYHGGVSDPRMVDRLRHMAPTEPVTPEQRAAALEALTQYTQANGISPYSARILHDMIFGPDDHTAKEAA